MNGLKQGGGGTLNLVCAYCSGCVNWLLQKVLLRKFFALKHISQCPFRFSFQFMFVKVFMEINNIPHPQYSYNDKFGNINN